MNILYMEHYKEWFTIFIIYVINKILKTLFKKRSLVRYYYFNNIANNIYIDFDDWAFGIVRFTVFNLNITKLYNFLCTFHS